jgi:hypothetical protein
MIPGLKQLKEGRKCRHRAAADQSGYFNFSNTPNFGQPGNSVTAANFAVIQTTQSQRGDFGSSRQIEFALKILF